MSDRPAPRTSRLAAPLLAVLALAACSEPAGTATPPPSEMRTLPADAAPAEALGPRAPLPADARHTVVVWTYSDDAQRPGVAEALRDLGAHGLSVGPETDPAPFSGAGLVWYADHAAGKGALDLRQSDWQEPWDRCMDEVQAPWPSAAARTRPNCLRRSDVRAGMLRATVDAAERATASGAAAIALADEPSMTVRANPVDWCLCALCIDAFRETMRGRFGGDLPALNSAWSTSYADWGEVRPWTTTQMRRRCLDQRPERWNLAPWLATRAFQDATFEETLRLLAGVARAVAPDVPVGLTGTQAPGAYGGFDYRRLTGVCDYLEPYDIGLALPVARDLGGPAVLLGQTLFPADPLLERWRLWRGVARGARMSIVWSSRDALSFPEDGAAAGLSAYGSRLAPELRLLSEEGGLGGRLAAAEALDGGVRIVISQPSLAVRWMLDSREDGDTWPRRFGSHEATHSGAIAARDAAWRGLRDRAPRFIDARDLAAPGVLDGVAMVVLPDVLCLSGDEARGLRAFAEAGGRTVADVQPGTFDTDGRARPDAARWAGLRLAVDPGFARLAELAEETLGPPLLRAVPADGAAGSPPLELGLFARGDERLVVVVPLHDVLVAPDGSVSEALPAEGARAVFSFGDGRRRTVRDERRSGVIGTVAGWEVTVPPAGGLVFGWREPGRDAATPDAR